MRFIILKYTEAQSKSLWHNVFFRLLLCMGENVRTMPYRAFTGNLTFLYSSANLRLIFNFQIVPFLQMHSHADFHSNFHLYTVTITTSFIYFFNVPLLLLSCYSTVAWTEKPTVFIPLIPLIYFYFDLQLLKHLKLSCVSLFGNVPPFYSLDICFFNLWHVSSEEHKFTVPSWFK